MSEISRAVFIAKDGTLVENVPYNTDPRKIVFTPSALRGLQMLADAGYTLVVITNQPGIALGRFTRGDLDALAHALTERLADAGIALAGFYACPHRPASLSDAGGTACLCRKPAPGMLQRAARELNLSFKHSWMVGDTLDDIEAGHRAGCRTVLLVVGNETEWRFSPRRTPTLRARDLRQAASALVATDRTVSRRWPPHERYTRVAL